jgi:hypothetical protein
MATKAIEQLWAKACPDEDPEIMAIMGMSDRIAEAFKAGRIDNHEGRKLQDYLARRDAAYLRSQIPGGDD